MGHIDESCFVAEAQSEAIFSFIIFLLKPNNYFNCSICWMHSHSSVPHSFFGLSCLKMSVSREMFSVAEASQETVIFVNSYSPLISFEFFAI